MNAGAFIDGRLSEEPAQGWSDANASGREIPAHGAKQELLAKTAWT
ncbi:hypothetical protein [Nitrobacter sp.]|nr:hypothetical protein [Nitrobacter sp.]